MMEYIHATVVKEFLNEISILLPRALLQYTVIMTYTTTTT